jgi:hypothetical protein
VLYTINAEAEEDEDEQIAHGKGAVGLSGGDINPKF